MRAQFGALTVCGLLLMACASGGSQPANVHPKARKAASPPAWVASSVPTAPSLVTTAAMPEAVAEPSRLELPPTAVPALPPAAPPLPRNLSSEIPARAQRPEKPDWTIPPQNNRGPPSVVRVVPTPVPMSIPVPVSQTTEPLSRPQIQPSPLSPALPRPPRPLPPAPQSVGTSIVPLVIDRPLGSIEARLPCNRAGSPHCDLRIYQVNVGTFVDGSPDHTPVGGYGPGPFTGDIAGVIGALDYIKALGFNTIWLTPIFDTAAGQPQSRVGGRADVNTKLDGTGYFPRDHFKIDSQFGTMEQARELVDQAHVLGLKVMFDGVFGHNKGAVVPSPTGVLPVDATAQSAYDGAPANYPGRLVDYSDPRSTAYYKEVARFWIDTIGIDGWRLDQVYQIPTGPLREITTEITKAANGQLLSGYVVGEMWGTAAQIRDVLGPTNNPALASAFDFPTRYALVQALATDENGSTQKPMSTINQAWALGAHASYPDHAIMNFMLGSHDLVRFGDLIERAGKGDPTSPTYWALHRIALTFMAAWSGPITLYYGEEVGAEVAGFVAKVPGNCASINRCDDHVARNMVALPGVNARSDALAPQARLLKNYVTALMSLRSASPALSAGSRRHIFSDAEIYVDLKSDGTDRYAVVMNIGTTSRQVMFTPAAFGMSELRAGVVAIGQAEVLFTPTGLSMTIPSLGAAIIKLEGR